MFQCCPCLTGKLFNIIIHPINSLLLYSAKWVIVNGIEYRHHCVLIVDLDEDDPVFAFLEDIYILSSEVFFKTSLLVKKEPHYHAYICNHFTPTQYRLIKHSDLIDPFPLHARTIDSITHHGQYAVVLKHAICVL